MEKINIAKLLKDCPKGMEFDCTNYDGIVKFDGFNKNNPYAIRISVMYDGEVEIHSLTKYGQTSVSPYNKCVIFPKGKTTWEGFIPPCKFKAGDVLVSQNGNIVLLSHIDSENVVNYHCIIPTYGSFRIEENTSIGVGRYYECVLANEQQRQRMYDKIKCSGYKYNQSTNTLEKLVKPIFKVGDRIVEKNGVCVPILISNVGDEFYYTNTESSVGVLPISKQDEWELVHNKFDITTLKPYDKVLVRDTNRQVWTTDIFSFYNKKHVYPFMCVGHYTNQCIPFEGNEHLLGKTDDCDEYYKTWE